MYSQFQFKKDSEKPGSFFIFVIMFKYIFIGFLFLICLKLNANINVYSELFSEVSSDELFQNKNESECIRYLQHKSPNRFSLKIRARVKDSKKLTAAVMAFPLPFGIVGLHRIYLGTEPYVPVVYIATVGGCFGILPLIDFFVIVFEKDTEKFANNRRVFMWTK